MTMLKTLFILIFLVAVQIFLSISASGEEKIDEDALFSDAEIADITEEVRDEAAPVTVNKRYVNVSGSLYNTTIYISRSDDYPLKRYLISVEDLGIENIDLQEQFPVLEKYPNIRQFPVLDIEDDTLLTTSMESALRFDLRLSDTFSGFINLNAYYFPQKQTEDSAYQKILENMYSSEEYLDFDFSINEFYLDTNIYRKVYFRFGKQTIRWGRGIIFSPTDMINTPENMFQSMDLNMMNMDAGMGGIYGLKIHVPIGMAYNIYGFIDMSEESDSDTFAYSGKIEFLVKNTEMAFSVWTQKGNEPVYGYSFSRGIGTTIIFGELSLCADKIIDHVNDDYSVTQVKYKWLPRASLGFRKLANLFNQNVLMTGEFYYNHIGYTDEVFKSVEKTITLFENGLYEPLNYGVYYALVGGALQGILMEELNLFVGTMANLTDASYVLVSGLNYNPWRHFSLDLAVVNIRGNEYGEFAFFTGKAQIFLIAAGIKF